MLEVYFTFGSDTAFPYGRDQYVKIIGKSMKDCTGTFRKHFPSRPGSDDLNCADYYEAKLWEKTAKEYYEGKDPVKTIVSDDLFGMRPDNFNNLVVCVPSKGTLVFMQEGSGDNLLPEDEKEGFVDYIDYTEFKPDHACGEVKEGDGGMEMFRQYVRDRYLCLADALPDILNALYGEPVPDAIVLEDDEDKKGD